MGGVVDANLAGPRTDWAARGNRAVTSQGFLGVGWVTLAFFVTAWTGAGAGDTPTLVHPCVLRHAGLGAKQWAPASGYKKPKVLGAVGLRCDLSGPPGYPSGLFIEHCRNLSPPTVVGCPFSLRLGGEVGRGAGCRVLGVAPRGPF